jgi:hypothetical protein
MGLNRGSGSEDAEENWAADEQKIADLVADFIEENAVPADVENKVTRLHDSGESSKALKIILESLD